ncbi:MAG: PIN domain-containing protein [Planctomycetaceae bacterium]|jgi:predicted nucleic acid-binding protein|nr:PIN domain-containing protein [Planctomycetaceae bacterium]
MLTLLIDTNIYLDVILKREPFFAESAKILSLADGINICFFITATTVVNMYYILRKVKGRDIALSYLKKTVNTDGIDLLAVDKRVILESLHSDMTDFEDAVQASAADFEGINYIITRNVKDFRQSPVPAISPEKLLQKLEMGHV